MPSLHNTLTFLLSLSLSLTHPTPTSALSLSLPSLPPNLPPHPRSLPAPPQQQPPPQSPFLPSPATLDNKCTFTLNQRHHPSHPTSTYIRIHTLTDHTNALTIDVALLRPREAFNSYARVSSTRVFAITGLLDGRNLTVAGVEGGEALRFRSGGLVWGSDGIEGESGEGNEAWCIPGEWSSQGVDVSRERKMECAFPCGKIEDDEWEGAEGERERAELR